MHGETVKLHCNVSSHIHKGKGKAVLLQTWSGPEGSRKFKVPRFHDSSTGWW